MTDSDLARREASYPWWRRTSSIWFAMSLVALTIGLGLLLLVPDYDARTTGTVTAVEDAPRGRCTRVVEFEVDGERYESRQPGAICDEIRLDAPAVVHYDPASPNDNDNRENARVTGVLVCAGALLPVAVGLRVRRTERHLRRSPGPAE